MPVSAEGQGMRVLIVKLSSFGDVVQTLPTLHDMRQALPLATFDWLTLHLSHTASMRILAMEQSRRLYLVTMDSDTASDGSPNQLLN